MGPLNLKSRNLSAKPARGLLPTRALAAPADEGDCTQLGSGPVGCPAQLPSHGNLWAQTVIDYGVNFHIDYFLRPW